MVYHSSTKACEIFETIDLLVILQKSLDRALFSYIFIQDARSNGARASVTMVHVRKFFEVHQSIVRFRFFLRVAKKSIGVLA